MNTPHKIIALISHRMEQASGALRVAGEVDPDSQDGAGGANQYCRKTNQSVLIACFAIQATIGFAIFSLLHFKTTTDTIYS